MNNEREILDRIVYLEDQRRTAHFSLFAKTHPYDQSPLSNYDIDWLIATIKKLIRDTDVK